MQKVPVQTRLGVSQYHNLLLLRHPNNGNIRGSGSPIAALQEQTQEKWIADKIYDGIEEDADAVSNFDLRAIMVARLMDCSVDTCSPS